MRTTSAAVRCLQAFAMDGVPANKLYPLTHNRSMSKDLVRVAAVGDLHCARTSQGAFQPLFAQIGEAADLLLLTGDLTDHGLPEEARVLAQELATLRIPTVAVLGNHDYESNQQLDVRNILTGAGVTVLDGEACEVLKIGIAGVKGFAGGFGKRALGPWGEAMIKQFVHEAVNEALKLEAALARLRTPQIIALMHYSPIQQTVEGEPLEIYAFVGSSRLEEPLNRYPVTLAFHGHAHRGQPHGTTASSVPVYNVSMPLLTRTFPDKPPFRLMTLPVDTPGVA
jgi:Icc-related predicted phosphoesterase